MTGQRTRVGLLINESLCLTGCPHTSLAHNLDHRPEHLKELERKREIKWGKQYCFIAGMKIEQTPFLSCVFQPASFIIYHRLLIKFFIPPGLYIPVRWKKEDCVGRKLSVVEDENYHCDGER